MKVGTPHWDRDCDILGVLNALTYERECIEREQDEANREFDRKIQRLDGLLNALRRVRESNLAEAKQS